MEINADLSQRAVVESEALAWVPSPSPGVERRMLDRDGGEVARATTIVRFEPGRQFPEHEHGGGEEFLVLAGVFSDPSGDFGPGAYVRNPPGTRHAPWSDPGAVLFVKLRQMADDDDQTVQIDTTDPALWQDSRTGERVLPLFQSPGETVRMVEWQAGAAFPPKVHAGGAEFLVLEGAFADADGTYGTGTWLRLPPGTAQSARTDTGCRLYVKTGHLGSAT